MASSAAVTGTTHQAPQRPHVGFLTVTLTLFAVPLLWGIHLVANFGLASHYCFPGDLRRYSLAGSFEWVWPTLLGIDLFALAVAIATAVVSYRNWRITRDESAAPRSRLIEIGEGRARFLSIWGLLIGALFAVAVGFDLVALFIVPLCG